MTGLLQGRNVVITAGASGIGHAIAEHCHAEGARIALCDVDETALARQQEAHPGWLCMRADVSREEEVSAFIGRAGKELGRIDALVNNAGIAGPTAPLEAIANEDWQRVIGINLMGGIYCTRHALPFFPESGGAIVFLSSIAGRMGVPERAPYTATKWAIIGLMKTLAIELGPRKIRVNAILPGLTMGPRLEGVIRARAERYQRSFEEQMKLECAYTALGEPCSADDIAAAALYLISDSGKHVTGIQLPVDSGMETVTFR